MDLLSPWNPGMMMLRDPEYGDKTDRFSNDLNSIN